MTSLEILTITAVVAVLIAILDVSHRLWQIAKHLNTLEILVRGIKHNTERAVHSCYGVEWSSTALSTALYPEGAEEAAGVEGSSGITGNVAP